MADRMKINKHKTFNHSRDDRVYLLSGIIQCACGVKMICTTRTSKGLAYKYCSCLNKTKHKSCGNKLEQFILDTLREKILSPSVVDRMASMLLQKSEGESATLCKQIQLETASLKNKNNNLYKTLENGLTSPEVLEKIQANHTAIQNLEKRLPAFNTSLVSAITVYPVKAKILIYPVFLKKICLQPKL